MSDLSSACARIMAIAWREHRGKTATAVFLMLGGAVAAPATALALRLFTNAAMARHGSDAVLAGAMLSFLAVATLTFSHFAHVAYFELSESSLLALEEELIVLANDRSGGLAHQEQAAFADRLSLVRRDIQGFRTALQSLLSLAGLALAAALTAVLLARLNPLLLLLLPLAVPPLLAGRHAEHIMDRARLATAERTRLALGLFRLTTEPAPGKELRIFRLQTELLERHRSLWGEVTGRVWRAQLLGSVIQASCQIVFAVGYLGGVLLVVREAVAGRRTVGDVIMTITLAVQVNQQVGTAVTLLRDLNHMSSTLRHMEEIRHVVRSREADAADQSAPRRLIHGIELVDVSFTYPGTQTAALHGVNLNLPAGATVAIVGENGAGKTSLVKLLCALYRPSGGQILVDGVDLRRIPEPRWQDRIAVGFQDFVRFELIAREAIGVGDLPRIESTEAVLGAMERAHARGMVEQLKLGLDTQLGISHANGAELSGGQWQKLALGRAFMREEPLLLVLDEPTAALDAQAEHALFERYAEQARESARRTGAITVLVSHRFSTVRMADIIVVLAKGRVIQLGDHETLIQEGGLYAELYGIQAEAYR